MAINGFAFPRVELDAEARALQREVPAVRPKTSETAQLFEKKW